MAPYEALYGRKCRSLVCWFEKGEKQLLGPELVQETSRQIQMIKENLEKAQNKQKSYADNRRKPLAFEEGERVFLKLSPTTGVGRTLKVRKLSPRYIGSFQILQKIGSVAYQLVVPPHLSNLHNVFHVSQLRKYVSDPSHILNIDSVQVKENLTIETRPIQILDKNMKQLRNKVIPLIKVLWEGLSSHEATWEKEEELQQNYPEFFLTVFREMLSTPIGRGNTEAFALT
ncbi:uncharacterized protein LOC133296488 [Gastrolobium bilobum]|uniref:uncharacterized protein LOC133296488 n=1 Tax=Gastrolobium bilobum TaxID=150636 RepID=UPI002AB2AC18|nr:uncharacterized protein LOC133296488 [Gastrolobium bilobum]